MGSIGVATFGSAHRPLGLAARTMGDLDRSIEHLEQAVLADLAAGDRPWHAMALATLAEVLEERAGPGDRRRAGELWTEAVSAAQELGMERRAQQWRCLGPRRDARCRRDGSCWTVELAGRRVTVPHCVGLDYLAQLVANPGVEIDALALVSGHTMTRQGAAQPPVVDRRAVETYRRRIAELRADIDEAAAEADDERAARARAELDELVGHLARSSGLHGAGRPFADDAERARVSVHKALKRALLAIAGADRALGDELAASVTTGLRCAYRPN
jgi:hypothetical protein